MKTTLMVMLASSPYIGAFARESFASLSESVAALAVAPSRDNAMGRDLASWATLAAIGIGLAATSACPAEAQVYTQTHSQICNTRFQSAQGNGQTNLSHGQWMKQCLADFAISTPPTCGQQWKSAKTAGETLGMTHAMFLQRCEHPVAVTKTK